MRCWSVAIPQRSQMRTLVEGGLTAANTPQGRAQRTCTDAQAWTRLQYAHTYLSDKEYFNTWSARRISTPRHLMDLQKDHEDECYHADQSDLQRSSMTIPGKEIRVYHDTTGEILSIYVQSLPGMGCSSHEHSDLVGLPQCRLPAITSSAGGDRPRH